VDVGRKYFEAVFQQSKLVNHMVTIQTISVDVTGLIPSEDEPLSDRFPFKYSGVPIVSNALRSFSVMCK